MDNSPQDYRNDADAWLHPAGSRVEAWNLPIEESPPQTMEELKLRESQLHVDMVRGMVPFWLRGIEAAEKGEELKLEEFLNNLQESSGSAWVGSGDPWQYANSAGGGGWGRDAGWKNTKGWGQPGQGDAHGWGMEEGKTASIVVGSWSERRREESEEDSGYGFVESIARQRGVSDEDKLRNLHSFYKLATNDKIRKINDVIQSLRKVALPNR